MKPGDRVRLKGKKRIATVVKVLEPKSRHLFSLPGVILDRRLCGFRYWNRSDLEVWQKT